MILFPDLPDLLIEHVDVADEITLTLRTTSPTASCPTCGMSSTRVQSRYRRTLHDLPSAGHSVHLIVHLRRFFCKKSTCAQKIFVERLPELCRPHAQRTIRLQEALCQLGLIPICVLRCHSKMGKIGHRVKVFRIVLKLL